MHISGTGYKIIRRCIFVSVDVAFSIVIALLSYWAVNDEINLSSQSVWLWAAVNAILVVAVFAVMEIYAIALSSVSVSDALRIASAVFIV